MTRRPTFETRSTDIDLRDTDDDGKFEGYACVYGVTDTYGTTFARGAFESGGLDEGVYALCWMHDTSLPGGTFTAKSDDHGLFLAGRYDDTQLGQDMRIRAQSGSAPGLSVGFVWRDADADDENLITNAKLVETSQITARMASVPGAQLTAVRHALQPIADALGDDLSAIEASDEDRRRRIIAGARLRLLSAGGIPTA